MTTIKQLFKKPITRFKVGEQLKVTLGTNKGEIVEIVSILDQTSYNCKMVSMPNYPYNLRYTDTTLERLS